MRLILKRSTMKAQYVCFRRPKLVDYKTCNCCYDNMEVREPCFCCQPPPLPTRSQSVALDSALNELGMLSTVTDSRRQFLLETRRRDRSHSEPSQDALSCVTPLNSPVKGGYQIVQLNTSYVVGVSRKVTTDGNSAMKDPQCDHYAACEFLNFGEHYFQEATKYEARTNRLARIKFARSSRRFKKPYEVPWHNHMDAHCHLAGTTQTRPASSSNLVGLSGEKPYMVASGSGSNPSTPEKTPGATMLCMPPIAATVTRSKSLDELDFAQLRLNSEKENCSFVLERKEIERMSQNFLHLQVNE
ncbi:hypothetical protein NP493_64g01045 [Ridgeia piscesae]|uniref:Uncharacterized protein n=1 Tax=Ridgeia piscesae TaxID=27915 RepID=A0AAD9UIT8_RIDPI|nr:hypothetical protein NP493_64g01045 [Ridgeia piscesae]